MLLQRKVLNLYSHRYPQPAAPCQVGSALDWISQRPNFLIVYDGADGHYSVVENFLPPGNGGNVMITSRNIGLKQFALSNNSMEVHGMEDEDAISLLLKSGMLDDTDEDI